MIRHARKFKEGRGRPHHRSRTRRGHLDGSVPDYDSNNPPMALDPTRIKPADHRVYEMGSTFKALRWRWRSTPGKIGLRDSFDAPRGAAIRQAHDHDFHPQTACSPCRNLTYSSNIATARMARSSASSITSGPAQVGQLDRLRTELPESAEPLVPQRWGELTTVTIWRSVTASRSRVAGHDGDRRD